MKIAIVVHEYPEISKSGEIDNAYGKLPDVLAANGHLVDLIYVDIHRRLKQEVELKTFRHHVNVKFCMVSERLDRSHGWPLARSVTAYNKLLEGKYDVIHIPDRLGLGWVSLNAKRLGIAFEKTEIVLHLHGPSFWTSHRGETMSADPFYYLQTTLEREALEMADHVVSSSQYMVEQILSNAWKLPEDVQVISKANSLAVVSKKKAPVQKNMIRTRWVENFAFLGNPEQDKDIYVFIDLLKLMAASKKDWLVKVNYQAPQVVFISNTRKPIADSAAFPYILESLPALRETFKFKFVPDAVTATETQFFFDNPNTLCYLASQGDLGHRVLSEALMHKLNFISVHDNAHIDLLDPRCLFDNISEAGAEFLYEKFLHKVSTSYKLAEPSKQALSANKIWLEYHRNLQKAPEKKQAAAVRSKSTAGVIVRTTGHPKLLAKTLDSIATQAMAPEKVFVCIEPGFKISEKIGLQIHKIVQSKGYLFLDDTKQTIADIYVQVLNKSSASHFIALEEGDVVSPQAIEMAQKVIAKSSKGNKDLLIFGYQGSKYDGFPIPFDINYHLFFDTNEKFPVFKSRHYIKSRTDKNEEMKFAGPDNDEMLFYNLFSRNYETVPFIILKNDSRAHYFPYHYAPYQVIRKRLQVLKKTLPRFLDRSLEMASASVLRGKIHN